MRFGFLFATLVALFASVQAQSSDSAPKCADLVLIGKIAAYHPTNILEQENVVVITWPWDLDIDVEQVILGKANQGRLHVKASLHTAYRGEIEHFLMFFTREEGHYWLDRGRLSVEIVRDGAGKLVLPIAEPVASSELLPDGWIAPDYASRLRPISIGHHGVWWMKDEKADGTPINDKRFVDAYKSGKQSDWLTESDGWIVPKRGLTLADLKKMISQTTPLCSAVK